MTAALDHLRTRIRELERAPGFRRVRRATGVDGFDKLVGGALWPGVMELCGLPGTGRTSLALRIAGQTARRGRGIAWVDPRVNVYPPCAAALGVDLRSVLWVRPAIEQVVWATEQVLRSGCFGVVVVVEPPSDRIGQRWALAAEAGNCLGIVVRREGSQDFPSDIRLIFGSEEVTVARNRSGPNGRVATRGEL